MPDWMTPLHALPLVHVLLPIAVPIAMGLSAWALRAGERRARARRIRDTLGPPQRFVEEAAAGQQVVLEGRIETAEGACARFEDGALVAVATVAAAASELPGEGPSPGPRAARSVRAERLMLTIGEVRVLVMGRAEVLVGSDECEPGAPFEGLGPRVRERIAAAAEDAADAVDAGIERPMFRSLRRGDRVRAAGVLVRHSEGARTGYREPAQWALAGDAGQPVVLAYGAAPRYRGVIAASIRGVRILSWTRPALAFAVVVGLLAGLVVWGSGLQARPPRPGQAASSGQGHGHPHIGAPGECAALKKQHEAAISKLAVCSADADCTVESRGGVYFDLEGCYRYRNQRSSSSEAAAIETEWLDEGCATSYEICPLPPFVMCLEGRCAERPPPPIPETWHREDVPGGFFLYLPPGTERRDEVGEDSIVAHYSGGGLDIASDVGPYGGGAPDDEGEGTVMAIGGHDARVWRSAGHVTVFFEHAKPCGPPRCRPRFAIGEKLTVHASCDGEQACISAWLALQSVRFW